MKLYEKFGGFIVEYDSPFDALKLRGAIYSAIVAAFLLLYLFFKCCGNGYMSLLKAIDQKIESSESYQKYEKKLQQRKLERDRCYGWDEDFNQ